VVTVALGGVELAFDLVVVLGAWAVVGLLGVLGWWVLRGLPSRPDGPLSRRATVVMAVVEFFRDSTLGGMSAGLRQALFPLVLTLFLYILLCNWLSVLPIPFVLPPTQSVNVTVGLALMVYVLTHYYGIRQKGMAHHFKGYLQPFPFLLPLNVVGDLGRTMSHGFRLFGNMLGGVLLMGVAPVVVSRLLGVSLQAVLGGLLGLGPGSVELAARVLAPPLVTPVFVILNGWFGLFAGLIQALVFTLLAIAYIQGAAE